MRSVLRQKEQILHRARIQGILNHPRARKIKQVQKLMRRSDAKATVMKSLQTKRSSDEQQLFWIAAAMQRLATSPNRPQYENRIGLGGSNHDGVLPIVMEALTHIYIHRNDKEVVELRGKRQPPRGEIRKLEATKEKEMTEFENGKGFLVPPYATKEDIQLSLEWLDAIIEFEESCIDNIAVVGKEEEKQKKNAVPRIPPAYIRRTTTKTSKRGNITPTDEFMMLVDQLINQDGIGNHLVSKDDEDEENDNQTTNNNDEEDTDFVDVVQDLADRKKKRRRFAKIKKFKFGGGANSSDNSGGGDNSNNNAAGAKTISAQNIAIGGMARRVTADKTDRDRRRKDAMKAARLDDNDNDEEI